MKRQVIKARQGNKARPAAEKSRSHNGANPRIRPADSKPKIPPDQVKIPAGVKPAPPAANTAEVDANQQQRWYEEAVQLFHAQKFDRAETLFRKSMAGPNRAIAHHAQIHSQICQKRLRPPEEPKLKTAEDYYNYAVTLINGRRLKEAAEHLATALRMAPEADHIHYALAAAEALQGNPQAAYERLKTAIALQPRNRILARGDADFAGILGYPPLASLLQAERGSPPKTS
jgi:tetratricopeptide (TPR) repeat protein